jgi:hypothetical protein
MTDIAKRIGQFVKLRDKINEIKKQQKEFLKPYNETLEQLNGVLLAHLNTVNGNSVSTDAGTAYRSEKKSASLADPEAFRKFVIANQLFDLIDWKANVTAVEDYINEKELPPPGVNYSSTFVAGVRRS